MCVCVCVFIKLHITAQPGSVKLIFQCYSNGSALWGSVCVCVCVYPFKLGFRVIYLILDCCMQTARILRLLYRQTARILTDHRSTRYENETVVSLLRDVCLLRGCVN